MNQNSVIFHGRPKGNSLPRVFRVWVCHSGAILIALGHVYAGELADLTDTIAKIKPSVVAIGIFEKTRRPPARFRGTGFVIGDGLYVATNAHSLREKLDQEKKVLVHQTKEDTLKQLSGISYAIPIAHLRQLLKMLEEK